MAAPAHTPPAPHAPHTPRTPPDRAVIESLDQEGRGVAHVNGKAIFIEGALPGEVVTFNAYRKKPSFELAQAGQVLKPAFVRVTPQCRYFGLCGGCSLQHMDARAQVAAKQRILEDNLRHIGKVEPELILPAVYGAALGLSASCTAVGALCCGKKIACWWGFTKNAAVSWPTCNHAKSCRRALPG